MNPLSITNLRAKFHEAEIKKAIELELTPAEISAKLNLSPNTLKKYCEILSLKPITPKHSRTILRNAEEQKERLTSLINQGCTISQIGYAMGQGATLTKKYIDCLGLKPIRKKDSPQNKERRQEMVRMRQQGATLQEIGNKFEVSRERVRQCIAYEAPESAFKTVQRSKFECVVCGNQFSKVRHTESSMFCSSVCKRLHNGLRETLTRDDAEKIMYLRDQGCTWDQVASRIDKEWFGVHLRVQLQRKIPILFSTAEQKKYFPKRSRE